MNLNAKDVMNLVKPVVISSHVNIDNIIDNFSLLIKLIFLIYLLGDSCEDNEYLDGTCKSCSQTHGNICGTCTKLKCSSCLNN